jgi:hypothetical protein
MMVEPTKSCVRVLRFESALRYYIKKILLILIFIPMMVCNFIEKYLNWCIIRAFGRWFGFPIAFIAAYILFSGASESNNMDGRVFTLVCIIAAAFVLTIACWVEVPEREREILKSYHGWNKND